MIRLVQISNGSVRRVAVVDEPSLRLVGGFDSVYALAWEAISRRESLSDLVRARPDD